MTIHVESNEVTQPIMPPPAPVGKVEAGEGAPSDPQSAPEANASEQNEASASEPEATEAKETEHETEAAAEGSSEEAETEVEAKDQEEKPSKKKGGFQRRIDKLTRDRDAAIQRAEAVERILAQQSAGAQKETPKVEPKAAAAEGEPNPDDYDNHREFVKAVAKWEAKQVLNENRQEQAKAKLETEQKTQLQSHFDRVNAFRAKHDDFGEMMENLADVPKSPALEQMIVSSENGPELLYELGKNQAEAKRIAQLPPLAMAREIGKIESRLTSKAAEVKPAQTNKITSAPKPITPIGSGGKGSVPKSIYDSDIDQRTYERLRMEERKKRRPTA